MNRECDRAFDLLSARLDGEIGQEDEQWLQIHLADCSDCREYEMFLLNLNGQLQVEGSVPDMRKVPPSRGKWTSYLARILIPAACLLLGFAMGSFLHGDPPRVAMSSRVAAPTAWIQAADPARRSAAGAAAPVTERIEWYQEQIAEELSKGTADWMRIRTLVESMNSWRTELELLTIHALYAERFMSPVYGDEGSAWLALLGKEQE
ncbi:MAG: zf-HC2 domain-containing protein [Thermovirgaceae bacterium]|nr:zf-HC2 domain-containing protein [Thermovirgaceae bacterium]